MNASEIMTRSVVTVAPGASIEDATRLMLGNRLSGLPVTDATGTVVGIITEGDLIRRTETGTDPGTSAWRAFWIGPERLAARYVHSHGRRVEEIMSREVITVTPATSLSEVVELMESRGIKRLPVLDNGRMVGIVSRADLLRALLRLLPQAPADECSDALVRSAIFAELDRQRWAPRAFVDVRVDHGVVQLRGIVTSQAEREALRVATENTPGVKGIVDDLIWVEPYSGMAVELGPSTSASG
jgi:CBS domain-containing protein